MSPIRSRASTFAIIFAACHAMLATPAHAADAVIVEVYQGCRIVDTNVVIDEGVLSPGDSAEVKARVANVGGDPQLAVPRMVQILKDFGIQDVAVSQQGLAGCEPETSGKFVEAVGTYCGAKLTRAEVLVDRQSFASTDNPSGTFEAFLKDAVKRLRDRGIYDRPVVSIENAPNCRQSS